jgi:DNA polymerase/3'-5' exonuclease PolX
MNNNNSNRFNEKFIDIMESLSDIMLKKGETFRARAYQKAQETIMTITTDIKNIDDVKGKPNIGPTILEKLNEIPLKYFVFDLIYLNGKSLLETPLLKRRELAAEIIKRNKTISL